MIFITAAMHRNAEGKRVSQRLWGEEKNHIRACCNFVD